MLEALETQVLSEETITAVVARVVARRAERAARAHGWRAALERELCFRRRPPPWLMRLPPASETSRHPHGTVGNEVQLKSSG